MQSRAPISAASWIRPSSRKSRSDMLAPFLRVAMTSPARQAGFRRVVVGHVALVAALMAVAIQDGSLGTLAIVAQVLLVLGIVEGSALIGWRLTQLPKSQALE